MHHQQSSHASLTRIYDERPPQRAHRLICQHSHSVAAPKNTRSKRAVKKEKWDTPTTTNTMPDYAVTSTGERNREQEDEGDVVHDGVLHVRVRVHHVSDAVTRAQSRRRLLLPPQPPQGIPAVPQLRQRAIVHGREHALQGQCQQATVKQV